MVQLMFQPCEDSFDPWVGSKGFIWRLIWRNWCWYYIKKTADVRTCVPLTIQLRNEVSHSGFTMHLRCIYAMTRFYRTGEKKKKKKKREEGKGLREREMRRKKGMHQKGVI